MKGWEGEILQTLFIFLFMSCCWGTGTWGGGRFVPDPWWGWVVPPLTLYLIQLKPPGGGSSAGSRAAPGRPLRVRLKYCSWHWTLTSPTNPQSPLEAVGMNKVLKFDPPGCPVVRGWQGGWVLMSQNSPIRGHWEAAAASGAGDSAGGSAAFWDSGQRPVASGG